MNRKWLFSTVAVMGMSLAGCCGNGCGCNDAYTKQLEDSIANLHAELADVYGQLDDCQKSKQKPGKKKPKKKRTPNNRRPAPVMTQDANIDGNNNCVRQSQNVVGIGNNSNNNTVIINNGTINNAPTPAPTPAPADTVNKPRCTVTGNINITVTRRTIVEKRCRTR